MPVPQFLIDRIQEINEHVQESFDIRQGFQRGINHEIQLGIQQGRVRHLATEMGYFEHNEPIKINRSDVIDFINMDDKDSIDKLLFIVLWGIYFQTTGGRTNGQRFVKFINLRANGDDTFNLYQLVGNNLLNNIDQTITIFNMFKNVDMLKIPGIDSPFFTKLFYFYTYNQPRALIILDNKSSNAIYKLNGTCNLFNYLKRPFNAQGQPIVSNFNATDYLSYNNLFYNWLDDLNNYHHANINAHELESYLFDHIDDIIKLNP
jgi:hypothetical protein